MKPEIKYIELKSGFADNGPAWIGLVEFSKSGKSIYFNGHAFKGNGHGLAMDLETREIYWITGIKKNGEDRHWAGNGKIMIDKKVVDKYLQLIDSTTLDSKRFELVTIEKTDKSRFVAIENATIKAVENIDKYSDLAELSAEELTLVIYTLSQKESYTNSNNGLKYLTIKKLEAQELLKKLQDEI